MGVALIGADAELVLAAYPVELAVALYAYPFETKGKRAVGKGAARLGPAVSVVMAALEQGSCAAVHHVGIKGPIVPHSACASEQVVKVTDDFVVVVICFFESSVCGKLWLGLLSRRRLLPLPGRIAELVYSRHLECWS